ncbi:MAG: sialidase family protein, partial [Thermomicrobiales bacterium]
MSGRAYPLPGMRVTLGTPRVVGEGVGHFWFPQIAQCSTGEILVRSSLFGDTNSGLLDGAGRVHVSSDGGETWPFRYDVAGTRLGSQIPGSDNSYVAPTKLLYWDPSDPPGRFRGHLVRFLDGGRRHVFEPWTVTAEGFPRDVELHADADQHGQRWRAGANLRGKGQAVEVDGELVIATYLQFQGDARYSAAALASRDGGRSWRFRSIIVGCDAVPEAKQGPTETALVRLADGDLMCVMRQGPHTQPLLRAYSRDNGATWTPPDCLSAFSVDPTLMRLRNGALVLAAGRPGIGLWISTDSRGESWQHVDLLAHHNTQLPDAAHTIGPYVGPNNVKREQTTSYTDMVEIAPDRLLLVYDRTPFYSQPVPLDSPERSRI